MDNQRGADAGHVKGELDMGETKLEAAVLPFTIGQALWAPTTYPEQVQSACPVCFGQLAIVVVLGDGEQVGVTCEACGKGFQCPRGVIEEWEFRPTAKPFVIAGVKSMHSDRWFVVSEDGQESELGQLCETEAEAFAESQRRCAEQHEANMRSRQHKRAATKEHGWSIQYHRKQIADLERQIAWHQSKVLKPVKAGRARTQGEG